MLKRSLGQISHLLRRWRLLRNPYKLHPSYLMDILESKCTLLVIGGLSSNNRMKISVRVTQKCHEERYPHRTYLKAS